MLGTPERDIVRLTDGVRVLLTVTDIVARKELGIGDGERVIDRLRVILTVPVLERVILTVPDDVAYGVVGIGDGDTLYDVDCVGVIVRESMADHVA